jgi:hypothetical protein
MAKLYFIRAFKKAKKFYLIYGNELKSVVIKGKLDLKIISTSVDKNSGVITIYSFVNTTVKRLTNYCYFV